jgi:hypothetical protein
MPASPDHLDANRTPLASIPVETITIGQPLT